MNTILTDVKDIIDMNESSINDNSLFLLQVNISLINKSLLEQETQAGKKFHGPFQRN